MTCACATVRGYRCQSGTGRVWMSVRGEAFSLLPSIVGTCIFPRQMTATKCGAKIGNKVAFYFLDQLLSTNSIRFIYAFSHLLAAWNANRETDFSLGANSSHINRTYPSLPHIPWLFAFVKEFGVRSAAWFISGEGSKPVPSSCTSFIPYLYVSFLTVVILFLISLLLLQLKIWRHSPDSSKKGF